MTGSAVQERVARCFADLAVRAQRRPAARSLAELLGAHDFVLFIRDLETGGWLPAPGFPQAIPGGHEWQQFLASCSGRGEPLAGFLPWLDGARYLATGVTAGDGIAVFLGAITASEIVPQVRAFLPLIAAAAVAEQDAEVARAASAVATEAAQEAEALSRALDAARRELERLYDELQGALRVREEFFSMAAHELKTPITSVKGLTQLLARRLEGGTISSAETVETVGLLDAQVRRVERLVAELLDVSRIDQRGLQLNRKRMDLVALARAVVERFATSGAGATERRVVLEADGPVEGSWDWSRLDDVLTNLVSNALKYSPEGGTVRVRVGSRAGTASLSVSDAGIGIEPEAIGRLFQPFVRVHHRAGIQGTGLGLYIARRLVEQHGGRIDVESKFGEGSTFTVALPR